MMALSGRQMTAQELGELLGDVPAATLYRHIKRLVKADILSVASERQVRGTVEKCYALNTMVGQITLEEFTSLGKDEHIRYYTMFTATLMDDFSRYLQHSDPRRMVEDGVGYRKIPLELSDEEFTAFAGALNNAIVPYLNNEPRPDRRRRIFSYTVIPDV